MFHRLLPMLSGRKKSQARRPANQARLTVEVLERRELLNATIPGFNLTGGNLYNTTSTQPRLIDSRVQNFTVVNNKVFDLHSDATLHWLNLDGTSNKTVDSGVTKFAATPSGAMLALSQSGVLWYSATGQPSTWQPIGYSVASFQVSPDGSVYALNTAAQLFRYTASNGAFPQIGYSVASFQVSPDGSVYALNTAAQLFRYTASNGAFPQIGYSVASFQVSPDGSVYALNTAAQLFRYTTSSGTFSIMDSEVYRLRVDAYGNVQYDDRFGTLLDAGVRDFARGLYTRDGQLTWADFVQIFQEVEQDGANANELSDLRHLIFPNELASPDESLHRIGVSLAMPADVRALGINVLDNDFNLTGTAQELANEVNKWFLGLDHPAPLSGVAAYAPAQPQDTLFGPGGVPSYLDVEQGGVGDCWLMASLAETAARAPSVITGMFTFEGTIIEKQSQVGVYSVRFYNSKGVAQYVTVDTELPGGGAIPVKGVLWVALAEKAYAVASGDGFVTTGAFGSDSYAALDGGDCTWALAGITGRPASDYSTVFNDLNPSFLTNAWQSGKLIVFVSATSPASSLIVGSALSVHAYALVGYYPSSSQPFTVFNPWNVVSHGSTPLITLSDSSGASGWASTFLFNGHQVFGLFNATASFLIANFSQESFAGTASGNGMEGVPGVSGSDSHPLGLLAPTSMPSLIPSAAGTTRPSFAPASLTAGTTFSTIDMLPHGLPLAHASPICDQDKNDLEASDLFFSMDQLTSWSGLRQRGQG